MLKGFLWQRTGGYYLFWCCTIYLLVGMYDLFVDRFCEPEYIQMVWILVISIPLWFKPLARFLNMKCIWEV